MDTILTRLVNAARQSKGLRDAPGHERLGRITLLPHQSAAVRWLRPRLVRHGGALLADPPGLGKTYVALALAAEAGQTPLVIAPASLRSRWREAAEASGVALAFVSAERLSAPAAITLPPSRFVIIDEAHHLRTCGTRRHRRTDALCAGATVLLLSATPIQNRTQDLEHLMRLLHLPPTQASVRQLHRRLTLRRSLASVEAAWPAVPHHAMPAVTIRAAPLPTADRGLLLDSIAHLPPLPGDDADQHGLLLIGLLHALRSSDAAARLRIHRRVAATIAIEQAAEHGIAHSAPLRRAWQASDGAIQLALTPMLGGTSTVVDAGSGAAAREQCRALEALLPMLTGEGDATRSRYLRRLARWSAQPVVAFTQFAATAADQFRRLRGQPGVALLTGTGGRIASGSVSRDEVLARLLHPRFAARHDAVRLLITTDVLSEGLSLAGVGTVVHLDLPWTPARLEQRVGRAARIGAPVAVVRVVPLAAPLPEEATRDLQQLLARKRRRMTQFEQRADDIVSALARLDDQASTRVATTARGWAVRCSSERTTLRALAIVRVPGERLLVALDTQGVRRPTAQDWQVVSRSTVALLDRAAVNRTRRALVAALTAWHADRELTTIVRDQQGTWLRERRAADDALRDAGAERRLQCAAHITTGRRRQSQNARAPRPVRENGREAAGSRATMTPRVRVLAGLCIVHDDGPDTDRHSPV